MAKKNKTPQAEPQAPTKEEKLAYGRATEYQDLPEAKNWNLNIFDLAPEEDQGPDVGDWVKVNIGESIVIRDVILVVGAKVYLNTGGFVLAQDVIEIR